ncbi:LLM class flavin-dependent oxidoreductase [Mycobacterium sp. OTB74]|jgi:alkanesulfonate monooxygenase SsuD/methylene tetrahydromethanopterin reductase-like flavin-dependent oxidoreductase (luciferase family)|uniref:LLM class flavin-dependent oxidoreductase n=1 Tax=Mycobacterium sp. OTB74 TaxID=1853452 RepID=UPI00247575ED|nr:LLM class flavin-dependent oxidoreductase [Mycobacterium sp. OTB74]MDH6245657.1 alkanesulfonate monooxygenase SsuD/methylene tetrahydromethanopterin reductase-like flavin-dependent oxidoreductase (luciferase family) [Mycobacterium sp. OTB74]
MTLSIVRFNFSAPVEDSRARHERMRAAFELSEWADSHGVYAVSIDEHHASEHGWSCNPILTAATILARTTRLVASVDCALGPLWHPVRLAEDINLVDTISGGRLIVTLGLGYRPVEYELFGTPFEDRGRLMDTVLETLTAAWNGPSRVTPAAYTRPHPLVFVGGSVPATARRAVRYGLPLNLPDHLPDIADYYRQLCAEAGQVPIVVMPPKRSRGMVFLHVDPDQAWATIGQHYLWEAQVYSSWSGGRRHSFMHRAEPVKTLEDVRAAGLYRFMTPEQLIADVTENPDDHIVLHPLVGAMPIDEAWKSVQLLTDRVLPALR